MKKFTACLLLLVLFFSTCLPAASAAKKNKDVSFTVKTNVEYEKKNVILKSSLVTMYLYKVAFNSNSGEMQVWIEC